MGYRVDWITESDLPEYFNHNLKVAALSGAQGFPPFHPFDEVTPFKTGDMKEYAPKFRIPLNEPGWRRTLGLFHSGRIVGDLDFYGSTLASSLHRVTLGMGIQREHTGKGQGTKLLQHGITWARSQKILEYLDLRVFDANGPALGLYLKCGFKEISRAPDTFRIGGRSIADVRMVLRL